MSDATASLYNRHRPTRFEDLVGQEHVARALRNGLASPSPPRAYLFSGPRGTGKTTIARILARCLTCQSFDAPTTEPCMRCEACLRVGHPDWLDVVEVDAASSARRIDEMRDWLETVRYAPVTARYRVTIMDEAHQIQDQAASALLKTLEEPPPHLVVILCTTEPWKILGTIRSRLHHYVLRRPSVPELSAVLERVARAEGMTASEDAIDLLARAADGSYRDGLGLLEMVAAFGDGTVDSGHAMEILGAVERRTLAELVDLIAAGSAAPGFELLESTLDGGADPEQVMRGLVTHLRHVCLIQQGARPRAEWGFGAEEIDALERQANQLPASRVVRALDLLADAQLRVRQGGADARLQLEVVFAKLGRPALDETLEGLAVRLAVLEEGAMHPAPPAAADAPAPPPQSERPQPLPEPPAPEPPTVPVPPPSFPEPEPAPTPEPAPAPDPGPGPGPAVPVPDPPPERAESGSVPPAPPAAAAPAARGEPPDIETLRRVWPAVLADLMASAPPVRTFLEGTAPTGVEGTVVTLRVPSEMRRQMIQRPDDLSRITDALTQHLGVALSIRFEVAEGAPAAPPAEEDRTPLDHEELRLELKTMFNAVPEE